MKRTDRARSTPRRFQQLPREAAGWLLLFALFYAPWAYGCTTTSTIRCLNWILGIAVAFWVLSRLLGAHHRQRDAHFYQDSASTVLFIGAGAILVIGWWMAANAHWIYDSNFYLFVARHRILSRAPGSIDFAISSALMWRTTLLIGILFLAANLMRDRVWLLRLWWTITLVGGSIAFFGLIQKATGAEMIFWQKSFDTQPINFFATYYYHGNAGAYLNLALPPAFGLSVRAFTKRRGGPISKTAALLTVLLLLVALVANTSRMAQVIAAFLLIALVFYFRETMASMTQMKNVKTLLLTGGVLAFAVIAIAQVSHLDEPLTRWRLTAHAYHDARWQASRAALRAVGDAGFLGFGPGTFRVMFPYYTAGLPDNIQGTWRFLHEDYLQTVLEWGLLGSALLAVLFFGGIVVGTRNLTRRGRLLKWSPRQRLFLPMILLAVSGIAVHALVDFPLQIASLQLYVAVYLGICWGSSYWGEKKKQG